MIFQTFLLHQFCCSGARFVMILVLAFRCLLFLCLPMIFFSFCLVFLLLKY